MFAIFIIYFIIGFIFSEIFHKHEDDYDPVTMPEEGVTITGNTKYITIDQIIEAESERVPSVDDSQKKFKIGYIIASRSDTVSYKSLQSIKTVIENWENWSPFEKDTSALIQDAMSM